MSDISQMELSNTSLHDVEIETERFDAHHFVTLPHPPPMEEHFQRETAPERREHLTRYGLGALVIYDFFLAGDYLMYPRHFATAMAIRLGVITPLVLVFAWWLQKPRSAAVREGSTVLLCFAGFCSILLMHGRSDLSSTVQSEPGLLMVLLCMSVILRVEFAYAAVGTLLCLAAECYFLYTSSLLTTGNRFTIGVRVFWVAVLTLVANYSLARERRLAWLQKLHSRVQRHLLAHANAELVNLSATDRLTGLSNRYGYDLRMAELWASATAGASPVSAIMIDVDHFKQLNDSFGHPYGDRVLRRIALLMRQALREEEDFVARLGGEEFVVLLPQTDTDVAMRVAERIRLLVQVAGSPAMRGETQLTGDERWSTVSCGVATAVPVAGMDSQQLIEAADDALYRAKQTGRNRVVASAGLDTLGRLSIVSRAS